MSGPLEGISVLEIASIGPGPFGAMLLADLGADVVRVERPEAREQRLSGDVLARGRRTLCVDLKHPEGASVVLRLVEGFDVLVEGFRPGVAERLGIGPDACLERNPRLVYGRMTGWGQEGPLADRAGHDLNYIALAGALYPIGAADTPPPPPLNLVGDFGGGGAFLALGVLAALVERERSGQGQVVDAAMVDGASILVGLFHGLAAAGMWSQERGSNALDGGAHFYSTYETSEGAYISVAAVESQFYAELLGRLGLDAAEWPQYDRARWPEFKERFADLFRSRTRNEWEEVLGGSDTCFAPVLTLTEAAAHPHAVARGAFVDVGGIRQPAPAPRFSRTPARTPEPAPSFAAHTDELLAAAGLANDEVARLREEAVIV